MTVSSTTTRNSYTGDGSTTVFAYTFKIFDDDDITVILRTTATGTETVQTKTTHYSVSGVGSAGGGNITFVTAPTAAQTVVLLRQTAQTQTTDYTPNDPFPAASHEDALDKMTLIIQDQQDELDRAIKLSRTNTMTSTEFTVGASDRASKVLAFDTSGELSVTQELGTFRGNWSASTAFAERDLIKDTTNNNIYLANTAHTSSGSLPISTNADSSKWDLIVDAAAATTSATSAAASATAAASSATAASASETAAAASESAAATSETNAAASETAAAASASSASTSATNASTSETNAATSASAASTSASNAATSATSASNSATSASTSASNAATSETNASNSASAASTSASNAATSETNAATSESNAATSASSAASDASAAASSAAAAAASFDAFDDIYLGAKASAPTVDNDGDALTEGDQYFNTTNSTLFVWNGSAWQAASPDIVGDTTPQLGGNLDTNGNDINFGDNDKAVFGAGSDLQIYHNGTQSIIEDVGTGPLRIRSNSISIENELGTETISALTQDGAVTIYYDGSPKLATTSSGIDVTGTVTTDGLTVDGASVFNQAASDQSGGAAVKANGTAYGTNKSIHAYMNTSNAAKSLIYAENGAGSVFNVDGAGDISFYDSTGTTQGFFWDASAESLGLGTTSPASSVSSSQAGLHIADTNVAYLSLDNTNTNGHKYTVFSDDAGNLKIYDVDAASYRMAIDDSGSVGIGVTAPSGKLHLSESGATNQAATIFSLDGYHSTFGANLAKSSGTYTTPAVSLSGGAWEYQPVNSLNGHGVMIYLSAPDTNTSASTPLERLRIDGSGNLLVGTTDTTPYNNSANSTADNGFAVTNGLFSAAKYQATANTSFVASLNRTGTDGPILQLRNSGTTVGSIGAKASDLFLGTGVCNLRFVDSVPAIYPVDSGGSASDNTIDIGGAAARFDDIYATNGTIQTSDANEKQDIEELTDAEQRVAVAAKGLLRKYRWKSSVEEKGDDARIHFGIIAQDLQAAFEAEGLDAGRYAMFINSEWTDEETGEQKSRMGIRYNQLLAFIIAAI